METYAGFVKPSSWLNTPVERDSLTPDQRFGIPFTMESDIRFPSEAMRNTSSYDELWQHFSHFEQKMRIENGAKECIV